MPVPAISILLANYNGATYLRECLDSIIRHTTDISYEIILVDDCSTDTSIDLVRREYPDVRIIENATNVGFARSNNVGVTHAQGSFICLFNTDIILLNNAVLIMHDYLTNHSDVGVVGTWLKNRDGTSQVSYGSSPSITQAIIDALFLNDLFPSAQFPNKGVKPPRESREPRTVDYVTGAALMTRRELVDEIGLFDERFYMYCEEADFCYRVRHQKKLNVCFLPDVQIIHYGGVSFQDHREYQIRLQYASYDHFLKKHHGLLYAVITRWLYAWHYAVKMVYRGIRFLVAPGDSRPRWQSELKSAWYAVRYSIRPTRKTE